jgi:hypothetical protein
MREQYGSPGLFSASLVQGVFLLAFLLSGVPPFRGMAAARRPFSRNATKRFVNRLPNGKEVAFHGVYREIARPERVVNTEIFEEYPDVESVVTTILTRREREDTTHGHGAVSVAGSPRHRPRVGDGQRRRAELRPSGGSGNGPRRVVTSHIAGCGT